MITYARLCSPMLTCFDYFDVPQPKIDRSFFDWRLTAHCFLLLLLFAQFRAFMGNTAYSG